MLHHVVGGYEGGGTLKLGLLLLHIQRDVRVAHQVADVLVRLLVQHFRLELEAKQHFLQLLLSDSSD